MGIDIHALFFLRSVKNKKPLGDTITIGRQRLDVVESTVRKLAGTKPAYKNQPYCEDLLTEYFGATKVDSLDNSTFENATHVHDMNEPLPKSLYEKYDTVIDGGSLEHVYNVPQALKNCSHLLKPGGQIMHFSPANNFCGHGFWQVSPELFFSLYSAKNGYRETEVLIADLSDTTRWYRVKEPRDGKRVVVYSLTRLNVLVRTVLDRADFSHSQVQQSDYVYEWGNSLPTASKPDLESAGLKQKLKKIPLVYPLLAPIYHHYLCSKARTGLNDRNPGLTVIDLRRCL